MTALVAQLGEKILPSDQSLAGTAFSIVKLNPDHYTGASQYSFVRPVSTPFTNRLASASNRLSYISYMNSWLSTPNANAQATPPQNFAAENYCLRLNARIDKSPWPRGQRYVTIVALLDFAQAYGSNGGTAPAASCITYPPLDGGSFPGSLPGNSYFYNPAGSIHGSVTYAPSKVNIITWDRNDSPFTVTLSSGATAPCAAGIAEGYPDGGAASVNATFSSINHLSGVDVSADDDAYTTTNIQLSFSTPTFPIGGKNVPDPIVSNFPQPLVLPGSTWQPAGAPYLSGASVFGFQTYSGVQLGWTVSTFNPASNPFGSVQTLVFTIAAFGWSPEVNDSGTAV